MTTTLIRIPAPRVEAQVRDALKSRDTSRVVALLDGQVRIPGQSVCKRTLASAAALLLREPDLPPDSRDLLNADILEHNALFADYDEQDDQDDFDDDSIATHILHPSQLGMLQPWQLRRRTTVIDDRDALEWGDENYAWSGFRCEH